MNINLKQIESFIWVAELGSFKKAASRLHTTQPNISNRIAALEENLQCVLMERDAGSVSLTQKGRDMLPLAHMVMASLADFESAALDSRARPGTLKLGVTELIVHTWLPDFLHELKQLYPKVMVELVIDLSVNLEQQLLNKEIDLAFQNGPFENTLSGQKEIQQTPFVWVASPKLGLPKRRLLCDEELAAFPLLTHSRQTRQYQEISAFLDERGVETNKVPSSSLTACVQMAVDGYGISAVLEPLAREYLKSGQLHKVNVGWQPQPLTFFARYHKSLANDLILDAVALTSSS